MKKLLLVAGFLSLLTAPLAIAAPYGPIMSIEDACGTKRDLQQSICRMGRRGEKVNQAQQDEGGRTLSILRKRMQDQRSYLVPKWQQKPAHIDLRSSAERMKEIQKKRHSTLKSRAPEESATTKIAPLLRIRATSGTRGESVPPVCSRRHGLELIACLTELGIEISPQTVDAPTLELYQGQQAEEQE